METKTAFVIAFAGEVIIHGNGDSSSTTMPETRGPLPKQSEDYSNQNNNIHVVDSIVSFWRQKGLR
jgi:hypothetical protein